MTPDINTAKSLSPPSPKKSPAEYPLLEEFQHAHTMVNRWRKVFYRDRECPGLFDNSELVRKRKYAEYCRNRFRNWQNWTISRIVCLKFGRWSHEWPANSWTAWVLFRTWIKWKRLANNIWMDCPETKIHEIRIIKGLIKLKNTKNLGKTSSKLFRYPAGNRRTLSDVEIGRSRAELVGNAQQVLYPFLFL